MTNPILTPAALEAMDAMFLGALSWMDRKDALRAAFIAAIAALKDEGRITEGNTTNPSLTIWLLPEEPL